MRYESESIEYKSEFHDGIYKEVTAFANTDGGVIYIGVDDDGNPVGIKDMDETYTRLTNGIRDAILPDVTMHVRYAMQENQSITVEVQSGSDKPYYLKSKGLKPSGVFVRQGASSVPASFDQIRRMIKQSDGDVFEEMRSVEQELSFQEAEAAFARYRVDFSPEKFVSLGIRNLNSGQFTNLAWILSDQCPHSIKIAVFSDEANTQFQDNREFTGSILRQLDESYAFLSFCNHVASSINGLERIEQSDYPPEAIREALLNALVHRDYGYSGSIIININASCMEFISLGGLVSGLTAEDIRIGISQPRNRRLAEIFHRLRLIESYGTGIRRIFNLYKSCPIQPRIEVTANTFRLILPNMNACAGHAQSPAANKPKAITPQMKIVLDYLSEYHTLNDAELQELLNIKKTRAYTLVRQMAAYNLIEIIGRGDSKIYKLK